MLEKYSYLSDITRKCSNDDLYILTQNSNDIDDDDCLEVLKENFHFEKQILPKGAYGAAIIVRDNNNNSLLLKIKAFHNDEDSSDEMDMMRRDDNGDEDNKLTSAANEIFAACEINKLHKYCECFTYMFGWIRCSNIPSSWRYALFNNYMELDFMRSDFEGDVLVSLWEIVEYSINDKSLIYSQENIKGIIFMLLYALYIGRKIMGFNHNDLHSGNVRIHFDPQPNGRKVVVGETVRYIKGDYIPKLIDYDMTTFNEQHKTAISDIINVFEIINELMGNSTEDSLNDDYDNFYDSELVQNLFNAQYNDWKVLEDVLLKSNFLK